MDETFTCEFNDCNRFYELPVILPCGYSICLEHLIGLKLYDCQFCGLEHRIPDNGFELNKSLLKVLNLNLHLNEKQKAVKNSLKVYESVIDEFYFVTNDSQRYLFDYIVGLKNRIETEKEKLKDKVNLPGFNELMKKISDYDEKCKKNLINLKNLNELNKLKYEALIEEFVSFREELRKPKISTKRLNELLIEIENRIEENQLIINNGRKDMLMGKYVININPIANLKTSNEVVNINENNNTKSNKENNNLLSYSTAQLDLNQNPFASQGNHRFVSTMNESEINKQIAAAPVAPEKINKRAETLKKPETNTTSDQSKSIIAKCTKTLTGHKESVKCIKLLGNKVLISGSQDKNIKIWDITKGEAVGSLIGHKEAVSCLELLSESLLISGSWDRSIKVWDLKNLECVNTLTGHEGSIICFLLLDNDELYSGAADNTIRVWNNLLEKDSKFSTVLSGHTSVVRCLKISLRGKLISGSNDKTIKIWNLDTNKCEDTLIGHTNSVNCLEIFSTDKIISGSSDTTIKIWNIDTSVCLKTINDNSTVLCMKLLGKNMLLTGNSNRNIKIWNMNKNSLVKEMNGHEAYIQCIEIASNGTIVSCSGDKSIKTWQISGLK